VTEWLHNIRSAKDPTTIETHKGNRKSYSTQHHTTTQHTMYGNATTSDSTIKTAVPVIYMNYGKTNVTVN